MKYHLFVDNFRGFRDTFIPIADVNFLVGENSTGKTSILGLIKLFSGRQFLMRSRDSELTDDHVNFGNFSDMVSRHSDRRSYFHIGLIRQEPRVKDREMVVAFLYTFIEDEGRPRLSGFTFCQRSEKLSIRFRGSSIRFKKETLPSAPSAQEVITTFMPQWKKEHFNTAASYQTFETANLPGRIPLVFLLGMFAGETADGSPAKNGKRKEVTLDAPDIPFGDDVVWVAPIRTKPQRTYDELTSEFSPEGTHTPFLIRRILRSKKAAVKFKAAMRRIGQSSGLFQKVLIKNYGREVTAPFAVDIALDDKALNLSTVGYGVSQSLPILVEVLERREGTCFAIQQPEVHLHPRAQAALGDLFFQMAVAERKRFLIETHSDFAIDRFRMNYRTAKSDKPDSQLLFFERRNKHNVVTPLTIDEFGQLPMEQPASYRDFFVREEIRLLSGETT